MDLVRKAIKWYFQLGDIKITPWDLVSNDYAMVTQLLFIYARKNNEQGIEPLIVIIYLSL